MTEHIFKLTNRDIVNALRAHNELCASWIRLPIPTGLAASRNAKKLKAAWDSIEDMRKRIFDDTATDVNEDGEKQMQVGTPEFVEYEAQVEDLLSERAPAITLEVLDAREIEKGHTRESDGGRREIGVSGESLGHLDAIGIMTADGKPPVPQVVDDAEEGAA